MATIETIYRTSSRGHEGKAGRKGFSLTATLTWLDAVLARRRSRRALLEMTDAQLKDIGLSRSEAHGEACRPFWD